MESVSARDGANQPAPSLEDGLDLAQLDRSVSLAFLRESNILPLAFGPDQLVVAVAAPVDPGLIDALSLSSGRRVTVVERDGRSIEAALLRLFSAHAEPEPPEQAGDDDVDRLKDLASEAPVVRLVAHLIEEAVRVGASDVHIEPFPDRLAVRLRVDGMLRDMPSPPAKFARAAVSRIKIMANLNIAERRLPQDGRVSQIVLGHALDLRVSIVPTVHGESAVIRLLDHSASIRQLSGLGLRAEDETSLRRLMAHPNGMILVTGPTGSGKTTTLYTALGLIDAGSRKVLTIEDPVEYHMDRVNQIQVKPQIGLTFASILRSLMRQDPDVIMVGEMRDGETADIAVHAALTGHLVLSTLHTNSAAGALIRLIDMGVEPFLLTSTLRLVIGQRLVRTLCPHCKRPRPATADEQKFFAPLTMLSLFDAPGCEFCAGTGYLGRIGLFELMSLDDRLRALTLERADSDQIEAAAREAGMQSLWEDGLRKVSQGLTTLAEVRRVVDLS